MIENKLLIIVENGKIATLISNDNNIQVYLKNYTEGEPVTIRQEHCDIVSDRVMSTLLREQKQ